MIENFSKNVSRLRKEFGYSQEELAKKIDVNRQTISNIERGTRYPTFETLEKIAQVFKATPTQLFGTQKEIAVSDSPIILDRIDEYDTKIQNILKAEQFLNTIDINDIDDNAGYILSLARAIDTVENYLRAPIYDLDGSLSTIYSHANDIQTVENYLKSPYDLNDPDIEIIHNIANDIRTIQSYKDD